MRLFCHHILVVTVMLLVWVGAPQEANAASSYTYDVGHSCDEMVDCIPCFDTPSCAWTNGTCYFRADSIVPNKTSAELCSGDMDDDLFNEVAAAVESAREDDDVIDADEEGDEDGAGGDIVGAGEEIVVSQTGGFQIASSAIARRATTLFTVAVLTVPSLSVPLVC